MRNFLCLLLGSAAVVGFETTFGLGKKSAHWADSWPVPRIYPLTGNRTLNDILVARPGGIICVRNPGDFCPTGDGGYLYSLK